MRALQLRQFAAQKFLAVGCFSAVLWKEDIAGLSCNPITAIGVGSGGQCSSQPVCCTGNHMGGLVVVGCSPVNVNA
ncbi:hydrophobin-domain-containing protein [Agrocybe pediades]|nr:hydrophobin-domain-containing protein [Agrocybe pediades]